MRCTMCDAIQTSTARVIFGGLLVGSTVCIPSWVYSAFHIEQKYSMDSFSLFKHDPQKVWVENGRLTEYFPRLARILPSSIYFPTSGTGMIVWIPKKSWVPQLEGYLSATATVIAKIIVKIILECIKIDWEQAGFRFKPYCIDYTNTPMNNRLRESFR